jgi:phosphosulfolactate phosphohydrolase-like enzyme
LATTNGAPMIVAATQHAARVLLGSLLNLDAVIWALRPPQPERELDVQIVTSGTDGSVALEDVYVAGRISAALPGPRSDAALVAEAVARAFDTPLAALHASADACVLRAAGLSQDIAYCAHESELDVVPVVVAAGSSVATVVDMDAVSKALLAVVDPGDSVLA